MTLNDLGHSVTPIFLLIDLFLYQFSTFCTKMKKIYRLEVWISCKMYHWITLFLALHLSVLWFQMPLKGLGFQKTLATFGIIYATDPLLQNMTKIVCLRWLTFDIFNYRPPVDHAELHAPIFQNQGSFPHALSLKRSRWTPIFFAYLTHGTHYPNAVKNFKKSIDWKIFAWTSLNSMVTTTGDPSKTNTPTSDPKGQSKPRVCPVCSKVHTLSNCDEFKKKTVKEQLDFIQSVGLCFDCLSKGHYLRISIRD